MPRETASTVPEHDSSKGPGVGIRIIPRLDIKGPNLVKGIHLEGLRVLGKPEQFARYYYDQGADELFYMDAVASLYERNGLAEIIRRTAEEIRIPLTVGGGIRSVDDVRQALRCGADKVAINTAAIARPAMIREAAESFGSSTIIVSIEAIRHPDGRWYAYTDCGRNETGRDAIEWAAEAIDLGAGELIVTSVDREGTGKGYDIELTRQIAESAPVPVIACGGAGKKEHVQQVIEEGRADAVSLASSLHYHFLSQYDALAEDYRGEGNTEFLRKQGGGSAAAAKHLSCFSLPELKSFLTSNGIDCRCLEYA